MFILALVDAHWDVLIWACEGTFIFRAPLLQSIPEYFDWPLWMVSPQLPEGLEGHMMSVTAKVTLKERK